MPTFTSQSLDLQALGPIVDVHIAIGSALEEVRTANGQVPPAPVSAVAMIDTGASGSVVQAGLLSSLGLQPVSVAYMSTPSSTNVVCNEFLVRLVLGSAVAVETTVIEAPLAGQHIQCLIGRDVLARTVLVYIGQSNLFSLSF